MSRSLQRRLTVLLAATIAILGTTGTAAYAATTGLDGTVTDAATGAPVANATVRASLPSGISAGRTTTDSTGHYALPALADGQYSLEVSTGGTYSTAYLSATAPGTYDIALSRPGSVSGRVTYSDGVAAAHAKVTLWAGVPPATRSYSAYTSADGTYQVTNVPVGQYPVQFQLSNGVIQWGHDKSSYETADRVTVTAAQDTVFDEVIRPLATLTVTVLDAVTRAPLSGIDVTAVKIQSGNGGSGVTAADGTASISYLEPGDYVVKVNYMLRGGYLNEIGMVTVTLDGTALLTVELKRQTILEVAVRDAATGEPVSGACVYRLFPDRHNVPDPGGCTDATGLLRAAVDELPRMRLFVQPRDGVHGAQWVGASGGTGDLDRAVWFEAPANQTRRVEVALDPGGSIVGTVRDADTKAPVADACPSVFPTGPNGPNRYAYGVTCTGTDGTFAISGLGPYRWPVQFTGTNGYAWIWSGQQGDRRDARQVRVKPGEDRQLDIDLPKEGKITGVITSVSQPYYFYTITAVNKCTGEYAGPPTLPPYEGHGAYTLYNLATQNVLVSITATGDSAQYPTPVHVTAGGTTTGVDFSRP